MKRQLLHESHNRQDKAQKPDYQKEMRLKRPSSPQYPDFDRMRHRRLAKEEAIKQIRRMRFFLNGHHLKVGWRLDHFAKMNALLPSDPTTQSAYDAIRTAAQRDTNRVCAAVMQGTIRYRRLFGSVTIPYVVWECSGIECDEIKR
jgi:hypothetical protein